MVANKLMLSRKNLVFPAAHLLIFSNQQIYKHSKCQTHTAMAVANHLGMFPYLALATWTYMMEFSYVKKTLSWMFERILNMLLI